MRWRGGQNKRGGGGGGGGGGRRFLLNLINMEWGVGISKNPLILVMNEERDIKN